MNGIATLTANNQHFGGWKDVSVQRSIEQLAGTFSLDVSERWGGHANKFILKPGDACQLALDGTPVITGYLDEVNPSFSKDSHNVACSGRDKTGDLVDCSAIHKSGQWSNASLHTIASDLIRPFGLKLAIVSDAGANFPSFNIEEGETVFETLERACRLRALLLMSSTDGNVVIGRAGNELLDVVLEEGKNILEGSGNFSWKDRFSTYRVKGQGLGDDHSFGPATTHVAGVARDENITRYRPLIVLAEDHGTGASLGQRAVWESNVRMGRGARGEITVRGWTMPDGRLWQPNFLVPVKSPMLYVDSPMLIVGCNYIKNDKVGTITRLSICRREAFVMLAGASANKLGQAMNAKEQKRKKAKGDDWSML